MREVESEVVFDHEMKVKVEVMVSSTLSIPSIESR
jgi:hypothetical protein